MLDSETQNRDITELLGLVHHGDLVAEESLMDRVYQELRDIATTHLRRYHSLDTLQPTVLVHEAYIKLVNGADDNGWDNRRHFFGAASRAMRNIIVDEVRKRSSEKHGGGHDHERLHNTTPLAPYVDVGRILEINEALSNLEAEDQRSAKIVEMRFFAGLTEPQVAEILGISERTVRRDWMFARSWLMRALCSTDEKPQGDPHGQT